MVENALDPLDEMRERFMTINNCTPFSWAVSTRPFGKKIRDSVRSLGYIQWSEDEQTVFYKDVELLNVFIEDGLVALVTSYHKGYTCTGSTKIIHRYLPKELRQLVVYSLWIIHPFLRVLDLLIPGSKPLGSSFLWPDGEGSWNSQRLSTILKRETISAFKAPMTIPVYRHVAIAISRRHLN